MERTILGRKVTLHVSWKSVILLVSRGRGKLKTFAFCPRWSSWSKTSRFAVVRGNASVTYNFYPFLYMKIG